MNDPINRRNLRAIKATADKRLEECQFGPCRKGKLPKPLDKLGGERIRVTPLYEVSDALRAVFVWKTAEGKEQRQLYGWLFQYTARGLLPLARLDYHPSHKNLHALLNCEQNRDLTNRGLPGCKEFALKGCDLDPNDEGDRQRFVTLFCERFNIRLGKPGLL